MNEFGNKLKELRGKQSIREASRNIGISHTYLDSLEKGYDPRTGKERKPTIEVINKISKYYNYDFFKLVNLAGLFVSISEAPEKVKKDEIQKMKKQFEDFAITKENRVKSEYLDLFSEKLNYNEVMFFEKIYTFFETERYSEELSIKNGADIDPLSFIGIIFDVLVENKNSHKIEAYDDIMNEFSEFLKEYLNIK